MWFTLDYTMIYSIHRHEINDQVLGYRLSLSLDDSMHYYAAKLKHNVT